MYYVQSAAAVGRGWKAFVMEMPVGPTGSRYRPPAQPTDVSGTFVAQDGDERRRRDHTYPVSKGFAVSFFRPAPSARPTDARALALLILTHHPPTIPTHTHTHPSPK